ncbi:hypothetical protein ACTWPT_37380 [Nonomuraea sp. 3N208]|uniref:hypothetical protein n=1 Tax=Nonomuraea sp. 3N208 TaxID=3457421 RepID=UPI003FD0388A
MIILTPSRPDASTVTSPVPSTTHDCDQPAVAIVGASITGPVLALLLHQAGLTNVTVLDASEHLHTQAGGARAAYRHAAVDLRGLSPDAVEAVLAVYREEGPPGSPGSVHRGCEPGTSRREVRRNPARKRQVNSPFQLSSVPHQERLRTRGDLDDALGRVGSCRGTHGGSMPAAG